MPAKRLNLTIEEYHNERTYLTNTDLQSLADWRNWQPGEEPDWTYAKFQYRMDHASTRRPTPSQLLGAVVQSIVFPESEQGVFYEPCKHREGTKAMKAWVADQRPGTIAVPLDMFTQAKSMAASLTSLPEFPSSEMLFSESTITWDHSPSVKLKCRPDAEFKECICELKTTCEETPGQFMRSFCKLGYHRQAALYVEGLSQVYGLGNRPPIRHFVVSSVPPYCAWPIQVIASVISLGAVQVGILCDRIEQGIPSREGAGILRLDIPHYAYGAKRW